MTRDYIAIAHEYMRAVVAGEIVACKWVRLACQRQLNDLKRTDLRWQFDVERASHICRFTELLPHIEGQWARQRLRITLEPWQVFILTTVFGWVDEAGHRRFRTAYVEVPRKNAKSTMSAAVGLYGLTADDEPGAQIYSAATTRDQARIVWRTAKAMVERTPGLQQRFGVATSVSSIYVEDQASLFQPLSRDQGGNHDGYNVHVAIVDELHAHKTRDIWDVLETATGAREQPLIWAITTAGFNRAGICYQVRRLAVKYLDRSVDEVDETFFGIIYTLDDGDDWTDPRSWQKANPNWGVSVDPDDIERKARQAMQMASFTNNFLTKHLNVWVNADTAWMDMQAWERCEDTDLSPDDFVGEDCVAALDLASKVDVAANIKIFRRFIGGLEHFYVFSRFYLPEEAAEGGVNSHYAGWARAGYMTLTPGNIIDFAYIEDDIIQDVGRFAVSEVAYDPFQATYLATRLMDAGVNVVEYRNIVKTMSEPMKMLEALVLAGRLHHDGNPVMTWMISNVVAHLDAKDCIFPRKEQPENKIDGPVALIMALGRMLCGEATEDSTPMVWGIQ